MRIPSGEPPGRSLTRWRIRFFATFVFLITVGLPVYVPDASPGHAWGEGRAPILDILDHYPGGFWYTYSLAPLWLVALVLARRPAGRRLAARGMFLANVGFAVFLFFCIRADASSFFASAGLRTLVVSAGWLSAIVVLFWRTGEKRRWDVGGAVSAQALQGVAQFAWLPVWDAIRWWGNHETRIAFAVFSRYGPAWRWPSAH